MGLCSPGGYFIFFSTKPWCELMWESCFHWELNSKNCWIRITIPRPESRAEHIHTFFQQFPSAFFQGQADLCGSLCYEILKCCNHRSRSTQTEASALLYFFMRKNFEFNKQKSIVRSHLQVSGVWAHQCLADVRWRLSWLFLCIISKQSLWSPHSVVILCSSSIFLPSLQTLGWILCCSWAARLSSRDSQQLWMQPESQ